MTHFSVRQQKITLANTACMHNVTNVSYLCDFAMSTTITAQLSGIDNDSRPT